MLRYSFMGAFNYISEMFNVLKLFIEEKDSIWSTVVKERDMEIGHPTEVKHVNHVGWEVSSGSAPAWVSSLLIFFSCPKQICRHLIYS